MRDTTSFKTAAFDIECDSLTPTVIHVVCVEEIESGRRWTFKKREDFIEYAKTVSKWVGHNCIDFDCRVLERLWGWRLPIDNVRDTLIYSRLHDQSIEGGHSLEAWGLRLGYEKVEHHDWSVLSDAMVHRCRVDATITRRLYLHLRDKVSEQSTRLEHLIQNLCRDMHENGFKFNTQDALIIREEIESQLSQLNLIIQEAFPAITTYIQLKTKVKEVVTVFNPNSAKQIIERIHEYWKPVEKTKGHLDAEKTRSAKLPHYLKFGWKLSETNFATLTEEAPEAAKVIIKRLLLETRRRKLNEWLELVDKDGRIHGSFIGIGTWTHRMSHNNPNQANVAAEKSIKYKTDELNKLATVLGRRMRSLFICEEGSYLVGVDAEGIQLRILAQYLDDKEFTQALIEGNKEDGTDVHSKNVQTLNIKGVTRDNAKTFIYAWCLGAGRAKVASILNTDMQTGIAAQKRFEGRYKGITKLRNERIKEDAKRGGFYGLDGRFVKCDSEHHMLAGYLQCGEAVIVKSALALAIKRLKTRTDIRWKFINFVHDELIFEVIGSRHAFIVKQIVEEAIADVGKLLTPRVPQSGKGSIGKNWLEVH